jgi:hypothetical protein
VNDFSEKREETGDRRGERVDTRDGRGSKGEDRKRAHACYTARDLYGKRQARLMRREYH